MARTKRGSTVLDGAKKRLAALKTITPAPTFGGGSDIPHYEQYIASFESKLEVYNEMLNNLDRFANELNDDEKFLREMNRRMLAAVEAQYGPDSYEYETAGGTRTSDRKPPVRKPPANNNSNS
jgi:hypothetical protein